MLKKYEKIKVNVWTPLIGFDKENPQDGYNELTDRMGFIPDGVSAFLFHIDVIMQHEGMEKQKTFPPDFCSYHASKRNGIRERQDWTNHDLKKLVKSFNDEGVETYLSIMGNVTFNNFHNEWIYEHPEVIFDSRDGKDAYNVLRRMKDGSYFEDLFIDKLCKTINDYGFSGFLPTDNFCPMWLRLSQGDYSTDMVEQFIDHTKIVPPDNILKSLGDDSNENKQLRGDWLWNENRIEWIKFTTFRWNRFFEKMCDRLHAIGKKVLSLGVYCTDPFENYYCYGIDLRLFEKSGIDGIMPNIVPTGLRLQHPTWRDPYYNYMYMLPLISAFMPNTKLYPMLGVRDDTEEWDTMHHAPNCLERDIYMFTLFTKISKEGLKRCTEGFFVCLGDSLRKEDWSWLRERFDSGICDNLKKSISPTLIWSDYAFENMLPEYINTRRWTTHKYIYEMAKKGTLITNVARIEDLDCVEGTIFVPNFDLLSDEEKNQISKYKNGPVVCTAMKGFLPKDYGICEDIIFADKFSDYPACAFAFNTNIKDDIRNEIFYLCGIDDGTENFSVPINEVKDLDCPILEETLVFSKVTEGFSNAVSLMLRETGNEIFKCNLPISVYECTDGKYRISIFNPSLVSYGYALVSCNRPIKNVDIKSNYPVLPVKYIKDEKNFGKIVDTGRDGSECSFKIKVTPGGMDIVEVEI